MCAVCLIVSQSTGAGTTKHLWLVCAVHFDTEGCYFYGNSQSLALWRRRESNCLSSQSLVPVPLYATQYAPELGPITNLFWIQKQKLPLEDSGCKSISCLVCLPRDSQLQFRLIEFYCEWCISAANCLTWQNYWVCFCIIKTEEKSFWHKLMVYSSRAEIFSFSWCDERKWLLWLMERDCQYCT